MAGSGTLEGEISHPEHQDIPVPNPPYTQDAWWWDISAPGWCLLGSAIWTESVCHRQQTKPSKKSQGLASNHLKMSTSTTGPD